MSSMLAPFEPFNAAPRAPRPSSIIAALALAAFWHSGTGQAANSDYPAWSINGFGTLGAVHSSDDQADFVSNPAQPKGAGYTAAWTATPDSKLGIQLNVDFTQRLSAVVQLLSQYQYDGTFRPDLEWGNLKYRITPDVDIRAGRIAIPTYMFSDSLNVGYALPFARIPAEIDAQLPITHSDGVDASYRVHVGDVTNTLQTFFGGFDAKLPDQGEYVAHDMKGVSDTFDYGSASLHVSYESLHYDLTFDGPPLSKVAQSIFSVGASYDPGGWYASGEWIRAPDEDFGLYYGWYIDGGVRIDKLTPYMVLARTYMSEVGKLGLLPFIDQRTTTLGIRWDFYRSFDLKGQLDHTVRNGGFNQFFVNQQPGFRPSGTVNVLTVLIDFVF